MTKVSETMPGLGRYCAHCGHAVGADAPTIQRFGERRPREHRVGVLIRCSQLADVGLPSGEDDTSGEVAEIRSAAAKPEQGA